MPADLPTLTRLTEDVVSAMHVAEDAQRARRHRRAAWRRAFPLGVLLLALLVAGALALRAGPVQGQDAGHGTVAKACAAGGGALVITAGLTARRPGGGALCP